MPSPFPASKLSVLFALLKSLFSVLDSDQIKKLCDKIIDHFEDEFPMNSFVQWSCKAIRQLFDIPDNDVLPACLGNKDCDCEGTL